MNSESKSLWNRIYRLFIPYPSQNLPPGQGGLPWLGQFGSFIKDMRGFLLSRKQSLGEIFWARVYHQNTIFVSSAEANKWIFNGEYDYLQKSWPQSWKKLAGSHAQTVVTDKDTHGRQMSVMRKILTPTEEMLSIFTTMIGQHLKQWEQKADIDPSREIKLLTLQIDGAALLDINFDEQQCLWILNKFQNLTKGFSSIISFSVPLCPFSRAMKARKELQNFFEEVIQEQQSKISQIREGDRTGLAKYRRLHNSSSHPLALLLNEAQKEQAVTKAELKDQLQIMIFAGHEFPGAGLIAICLELIRNPQVVQKLRAEIPKISPDRLTIDNVNSLPYLDAFVKEILRIYPPVPGGYRQLTKDMEFQGYHFPRGWSLKFEPFLCHFDERYWSEPNIFAPERFLPPREEDYKHPNAYIPFGGGRRICPGSRYGSLLMKIFTIELVNTYNFYFVGTPSFDSKFGHLYQPHFLLRIVKRVSK